MTGLYIVLGVFLILILSLLYTIFSKSKVYLSYKGETIKIRVQNGLIRYTLKQIDRTDEEKKEVTKETIEKDIDKKKKLLTNKKSFWWTILREMRFRIEVVKTKIKIDYGTGDPADTGILYGIIWAVIGNLYQVFNQYLVFDFPETQINPDFENKIFEIEFESIIKVRLVHIINALLKTRKGK